MAKGHHLRIGQLGGDTSGDHFGELNGACETFASQRQPCGGGVHVKLNGSDKLIKTVGR
jgi:hypothetical protein